MNPEISIIVPVYNVEKYLKRCIDSILNQSFTDFELILVDDGSTDNSGKIIDEYALKDKRIKVIHKENGGQGSARNRGLDIAKGNYIGFVDSDDWIHKDMYKCMYQIINEDNTDIVQIGHNTVEEYTEDKRCNINEEKYFYELSKKEKELLKENLISFRIDIKGKGPFDKAQICMGGVPLNEINIKSMKSKINENLYITGEMLDVNGDCGGYNLTFAFISGYLSGKDIK